MLPFFVRRPITHAPSLFATQIFLPAGVGRIGQVFFLAQQNFS